MQRPWKMRKDAESLPSSSKLSAELLRLLTPLDSLDKGLARWVEGEVGKVGDGDRSLGDKMPGKRREPVQVMQNGDTGV